MLLWHKSLATSGYWRTEVNFSDVYSILPFKHSSKFFKEEKASTVILILMNVFEKYVNG